jgi:hypothetical protein
MCIEIHPQQLHIATDITAAQPPCTLAVIDNSCGRAIIQFNSHSRHHAPLLACPRHCGLKQHLLLHPAVRPV